MLDPEAGHDIFQSRLLNNLVVVPRTQAPREWTLSLYEHLVRSAPVGLFRMADDGTVIESNAIVRSLFDISSTSWNVLTEPAMVECGLAEYARLCLETREARVSEGACETRDGDRIYVRYYLNPGPEEPEGKRAPEAMAVVVDLSEIKQAEQKQLSLYRYFNSIVSGISPLVALDEEHIIQFANRSFQSELSDGQDPAGRSLFEVLKLRAPEQAELKKNLQAVRDRPIENCRLRLGDRELGYTVFPFEGGGPGLVLKDITRLRSLERSVEQLHSRLLHAQENERQLIAAELHDGVGQTILAAKINLTTYSRDPERYEARFDMAMELIDRASQELRDLYSMLFPSTLKDLGLEAAIRWLAKRVLGARGVASALSFQIPDHISAHLETQIYRITQELFSNIVKHAKARHVALDLSGSHGGPFVLELKDDGQGFSLTDVRSRTEGFGLANVQRRVQDLEGSLEIDSGAGSGTRMRIRIPATGAG